MPKAGHLTVSLLIAASGLWAAHVLTQVDQGLRIIYAEYTLAATDLGHMNARLIRYRTTVLRAMEADTERQFESIVSSFPAQRERIEATLARYITASQKASSNQAIKAQETAALVELRERLADYIHASHYTLELLIARWSSTSPAEIRRLHNEAEHYAAQNAGTKLIAVSVALDRLLEIVAAVAGDARNEGESLVRQATMVVVVVSFLLAFLVLSLPPEGRPVPQPKHANPLEGGNRNISAPRESGQ